jgi:glycosyltransferase involved in cell wall biosynthesis
MRIAMIGIKAIPARFGGFETAVDEISRGLARAGHEVTVYNRSGMAVNSGKYYEGVRIVTLPTVRTKSLSTIVHSFVSTLHAMFTPVDVVHYFTTGATLFAPLVRLMGKKTICSVDGTDWQRAKWGAFARQYLRFSEGFAARFCDVLISDSTDVKAYYQKQYRADSARIAYGIREQQSNSRDALRRFGLKERDYVLFVGRLVPENNVHYLVRAFERISSDKKLVIVGDDPWEKTYVQSLKSTVDPRIVFSGGVYGDDYAQLQQNAYVFVLPDEVGGTHPALVEAMGFGNCVLVNDTPSNLEVIADSGFHYEGAKGHEDLRDCLQYLLDNPGVVNEYRQHAQRRAREFYRWEDVIQRHIAVYEQALRNRETQAATLTSSSD